MDTELSIQQVAGITQLSMYTLRYYERIGLVAPIERASSGHRRYSSQDIAWINFLIRLRATGMPIREMQQFAELRRRGGCTLTQRRQLLEIHQQRVHQQIDELTQNLKVIQEKIQHYQELEGQYDTSSLTESSH
ncbi:MerR family transcriptional regulator [Rivularia sp. UHCC 0363]|uniref:MerR family transcriptional regulator n=1 Tax=Rivularia sp. UHCC 0363 TaxID=3110244 RepID=UPI002B202947|nr:MerR family transcriptional regulator [Rivularia sp. UHCC 0363]MEA5597329.1 MerR family transcriptional regulator [Rivularia sp. UHCC 0363]